MVCSFMEITISGMTDTYTVQIFHGRWYAVRCKMYVVEAFIEKDSTEHATGPVLQRHSCTGFKALMSPSWILIIFNKGHHISILPLATLKFEPLCMAAKGRWWGNRVTTNFPKYLIFDLVNSFESELESGRRAGQKERPIIPEKRWSTKSWSKICLVIIMRLLYLSKMKLKE